MRTTAATKMLILLASLVTIRAAGAEDALSLQAARALALSRSATLKGSQLAVDAASLAAQAQGYAALPGLTAQASGSFDLASMTSARSTGNVLAGSAELSASETLFNGGKTFNLVKKYGYAAEAARESFRATRISLLGQTDAAFYAVLEASASVEAAASDLDAAKLRQAIAQAKIDAGTLSRAAYLQTQADTAGNETSLLLAKKTLASAKAKLASLTGLPASSAIEQVDFTSYDSILTRLAALDDAAIDKLASTVVGIARTSSPTLAIGELSSGQAKLGVSIAKSAYLPSVAVGVSQGLSYGDSTAWTFPSSVSLSATMSLDLWNTRNAVDSAAVAAAQADASASQGATDLDLNVIQALYEWISSAASIRSSSKALDYARGNYDNVLEQFKLSSATTSDLSTAQALVSVDETALISARYGFLSNLSTLRGYAGLEDESALLAAIP